MNTVKLTERFEFALVYANRLHAHQVRKVGGVPYITHLLSVAALVLESGGNEDEAIAALLHDAVEDQGGAQTREAIRQQFGDEVVMIIDGCTESDTIPKPPWRERKLRSLEKLRQASPSVRRVALADKLHNGRSLLMELHRQGNSAWSYFNASPEEILWFYQSLVQIYQEGIADETTAEFERVVSQLAEWVR
jgi:(p)ppGpp synthase/HD superfamily hydrolase